MKKTAILATIAILFCAGCAQPRTSSVTLVELGEKPVETGLVAYLTARGADIQQTADSLYSLKLSDELVGPLTIYLKYKRAEIDAIRNNIANANTTRDVNGESNPYRPRVVTLNHGANAKTTPDDGEEADPGKGRIVKLGRTVDAIVITRHDSYRLMYYPGHPDANEEGYVKYPDVDVAEERWKLDRAVREYEVAWEVLRRIDPGILGGEGY